ncbi:MAG: hypothetical protein IJR02_11925 [Bacteroidaceae bacterium]|nr:hypothetical protein [Bacteroidaceae bacterium]
MTALVYGENHNNTLGLVRSLGEAGHQVILLLMRRKINYVDKSRYVNRTIYLDAKSNVISAIKKIASDIKEKPVLFTTGDGEASLVDSHFEELSEYVIPEGGYKNNDINRYRDKKVSNKLAAEIGFDLPHTWIVTNPNFPPKDITFPVFVKANNSIHGGKSVQGIYKNREELNEWLSTLPKDDFPMQVQEYIDKDYEIMLQGCSINHGKKVISEVANRKVRFYPHIYSAGSYSYSVQVEGNKDLMYLRGLVTRYLENVGYSGLFSAEFLYSKGRYFFLEINFRNDGTAYLSTACGYNLSDIYCRSLKGKIIEKMDYKQQSYMNMIADLHHIGKHISFSEWFKQFRNTHCFSHYNQRDITPYLFYLIIKRKDILKLIYGA